MESRQRFQFLCSVFFLWLVLGALPLRAASPTEALFLQGKAAVAARQWDAAIPALEAFRRQAPTSDSFPGASVLLLQAYLGQGAAAKADALWQEILKRWPTSETAWQATELQYRARAPRDAAGALALLEDTCRQGVLPADSATRARNLHLEVMEQVNPAEFLARALPLIQTARGAKSLAELADPANLARRAYAPLLAAGRFDDARQTNALIQGQYALLGEAKGGMTADEAAYLQALSRAAPARAQAELKPLLGMLDLAETLDETVLPVTVIGVTYAPLMKAGYRAEMRAAHARIQTTLQKLGNAGALPLQDTQSYLESLAHVDADAFIDEGLPVAQGIADAKTSAEAQMAQAIARQLYLPLLTAKRVPDAKGLHAATQAALARLGDLNGARFGELSDYLGALEAQAPDVFLAEALPVMDNAKDAPTLAALSFYENLAARLYGPLMQAARFDEAKTCHEAIRDTRQKLDGRWNTDDLYRYFQALQATNPERALTEMLETAKQMQDLATEQEALRILDMTARLYPGLAKANRFADARTLHAQLARALAQWGKRPSLLTVEMLQYLSALATAEPGAYLAEALPIAKRAATATTLDAADLPVQVARLIYLPMLKAKQDADVVALHTQAQEALTRANAPDELKMAEMGDYLRALTDAGSPQLVAESATVCALLKHAATPQAAAFPLSLATQLYPPLLQQQRAADVQALKQTVTETLLRIKAPLDQQVKATSAYLLALEPTDPASFLALALPIAQAGTQSAAPAEIALAQELAGRLYKPLVGAKRGAEATALHAQVLAALQRSGDPAGQLTGLDWARYLEAMGQLSDTELLAETATLTARITAVTTPGELAPLRRLAGRLYQPLLKADREDDATALHQALVSAFQRTKLEDTGRAQEMGLYFDALFAQDPDRFMTEALATILNATAVGGPTEAARFQYVGTQLYGLLANAKRGDDVKKVHAQLQNLLTGAPYLLIRHADWSAYLNAVKRLSAEQFLAEAPPALLAAAQEATTPEQMTFPLYWAHQVYEPLMLAKQVAIHQRLHAAIQAKLSNLGDPQHARALADQDDYMTLLARINPPVFLAEAQPVVEQALTVKTLAALPLTTEFLRLYYAGLFAAKRLDDAKSLHARIQAMLGKLDGGPAVAREDTRGYWRAAAQAMPEYMLSDGLTDLLNSDPPATAADAQLPVEQLALTYPLLQQNNRAADAQKLHEKYQPALAKLADGAALAKTEQLAFLTSLAVKQPDVFLTQAQPLLQAVNDAKTPGDAQDALGLVKTAYGAYMLVGRIEEAKNLHARMQALIVKVGNPDGVAEADNLAYRDSLSQGAIDGMYALFKRAVAAGDVEEARKWLTNLNAVAPEHPKAIEARKLFQKMQQDH